MFWLNKRKIDFSRLSSNSRHSEKIALKKNKNRKKVENPYCSLGLLRQTMMISSADHRDLSVVCQAQAYQIVGQQKSGPLQPVKGGGGGAGAPIAPLPPTGLNIIISVLESNLTALRITDKKEEREREIINKPIYTITSRIFVSPG